LRDAIQASTWVFDPPDAAVRMPGRHRLRTEARVLPIPLAVPMWVEHVVKCRRRPNSMPIANDPAVWMWAEACELLDRAERMHRQFFRPGASAQAFAVWEPPIDVFEDERELGIVVAMPGVRPERVNVTLEPGAVVIRGEREIPLRGSGRLIRRLEIPYGAFERRVALPPGRFEAGASEMAQGCLVLVLRKLQPEQR
jgi:HSP20 family protein